MVETRIKPITSRDIADLIAIGETCGLSPWTAQNYIDELKNPNSIMLSLKSAEASTVGFIVGRLVPAVDNDFDIDAEIYNIAVAGPHRNQGLGELLLGAFCSKCVDNKVRQIWLEVRESNDVASRFYRNREFQAFSRRRSFYRDPVEDAILMRRTL
ncbi:MAG TPA: ribosomal protein S18-alanine N-acetyltransferase [Pyrinomonadaceae bacterium]|nr:ribosomal protein S18-alanine N-acetyltransferase [Pyrinomonadaceae bacterium]